MTLLCCYTLSLKFRADWIEQILELWIASLNPARSTLLRPGESLGSALQMRCRLAGPLCPLFWPGRLAAWVLTMQYACAKFMRQVDANGPYFLSLSSFHCRRGIRRCAPFYAGKFSSQSLALGEGEG